MAIETTREGKGKDNASRGKGSKKSADEATPIRERADSERVRIATTPRSGPSEHAVFLVPGLLGFERFATFGYFADRVVAALRASLEQALGQPVPVIAVPIPPTAPLHERQRRLVRTLADRLHALEHGSRPLHVHLVGHSTGGVDSNLLTHEKPLAHERWSDLDSRAPELLGRIRSVTSIASPHQGACLRRDAVARLFGERDLRGLPGFASLATKLVLSSASDVTLSDFWFSAFRETMQTQRFLREVMHAWTLLEDLDPSRSWGSTTFRPDVVRRSFVTVAGDPIAGASAVQPADAFFRDLSSRASGWRSSCAEEGPHVLASVSRLRHAIVEQPELIIQAPGVELPAILDAGHNDGVVNSARQLMDPSDPTELAGIIVGDHFDVVGYYDRRVWMADDRGIERPHYLVSGLLHSGSNFRDDQFFTLYRRVAGEIAAAARSSVAVHSAFARTSAA